MRIIYSCIALCLTAFNALAVTIESASGQLASLISDKSITELQVSGTINAVDFKFIADELTSLQSLDIINATITAYSSSNTLFANARSFDDNTIPVGCFASSTLQSVALPASLSVIGEGAFLSCNNITSITLPESLDSIAPYAFSACEHLAAVVIPASVKVVGEGAFSHCTALSSVTVTDGSTDLKIADKAFYGCTTLASANIANRTVSIGNYAFCDCTGENFAIVTGSNSRLSSIGENAFQNSALKAFDFAKYPKLVNIPQYAFANTKLQSISVPDNITFIGEGAFFGNGDLTNIDLASNSASISKLLFAGCNPVDATGMTDQTTEVGEYAYYGCNQINKLIIPENVTYIGKYAFGNMSQLAKVTSVNTTAPSLGEAVFSGISTPDVLLTTKIAATGYREGDQWKDFNFTLNGDASNNGDININDITSIISHIKGSTPKSFLLEAADANVDNDVDQADVTDVLNIIINSSTTE